MKTLTFLELRRLSVPLCALVACLLLSSTVQAGTIVGVGAVTGTGLGFAAAPAITTTSEGNDNQPGPVGFDANLVVPIKRFDHTGNIDLEFFVRSSDPGGVTEYLFFESVDNNTGIDWNGYVMELGFGSGGSFVASPAGDGLDFDAPTYDPAFSSTAFPIIGLGEDLLTFSGGIHSTGSEIYQIRIDVPDGIQSFTLRQYPVPVPEPSTLMLAGLAVAGLAVAKYRRRRR